MVFARVVFSMSSLLLSFLVLGCSADDGGEVAASDSVDVTSDVATGLMDAVGLDDASPGPGADVELVADGARADVPASPDVPSGDDVVHQDDTAMPVDVEPTPDVADVDELTGDVDEPTGDVDATTDDTGPVTVTATLASPDEAVASYLMDPAASAWNLFGGDTAPLGRHFGEGHVSYFTALRFTGLAVPAGATILSARLTVSPTNEVDSNNPLWLDVFAEKAGDSAPFDPANTATGRPDQRPRTSAEIDHWLVRCNAMCTDLTEFDCEQRKRDCWDREVRFTCPKDLAPLVQEVISGDGWASGNALTLLLINAATDEDGAKYEGFRSITGVDPERGPAYSPTLEVVWE
jgi:hypothetical protein